MQEQENEKKIKTRKCYKCFRDKEPTFFRTRGTTICKACYDEIYDKKVITEIQTNNDRIRYYVDKIIINFRMKNFRLVVMDIKDLNKFYVKNNLKARNRRDDD